MRLEWIEDLLAVAESESLTEAALRRNVSQPAFTRRIRAIESQIGVTFLDRSRRPARPTSALIERTEEFRSLARSLRRMRAALSSAESGESRVVMASTPALANSIVPRLAAPLSARLPSVRLRLLTANRHDCFAMLMTGQAAIMAAFETESTELATEDLLIEKRRVLGERLCPVVAAQGRPRDWRPSPSEDLPIIVYPDGVFMSRVLEAALAAPPCRPFRFQTVCETPLVTVVLQLVLAGWGMAWVPHSIAGQDLVAGRLIDLSPHLGAQEMDVVIARLKTPQSPAENQAWQVLTAPLD